MTSGNASIARYFGRFGGGDCGWVVSAPGEFRRLRRMSDEMETCMRLWQLGWLCLPIVLLGCGGDDKPAATLSVSCGGNDVLVGARSVDVLGDPVNGRPTLSFPDPVNAGKTGTLSVRAQDRCTITPVVGSGG
jgi:hypothetical protein